MYLLAISSEDGRVGALAELFQLYVGLQFAKGGISLLWGKREIRR